MLAAGRPEERGRACWNAGWRSSRSLAALEVLWRSGGEGRTQKGQDVIVKTILDSTPRDLYTKECGAVFLFDDILCKSLIRFFWVPILVETIGKKATVM